MVAGLLHENYLNCRSLEHAAMNGNIKNAKFLIDTLKLKQILLSEFSLLEACKNGHLEMAKYLQKELDFGGRNIVGTNRLGECLVKVCDNGYLEIAEWLVDTFGIISEDLPMEKSEVVMNLYSQGHAQIAIWINDTIR